MAAASVAILLGVFAAVSLDAGSAPLNPQPVTLAALMNKLESLQSQMQDNSRATEAMRAALAQQRNLNGRLLNLLAAGGPAPAAMLMAAASPSPEPQRIRARQLKWAIELCGKVGLAAEGKYGQKLDAEGDVRGHGGVDAYGTGGKVNLQVKHAYELGFELGPDAGLEATACLQGIEFDAVGVDNVIAALTQGAPQSINDVSNVFMSFPLLHAANLSAPLNSLQNLQVNVGAGQILDRLKQPATLFQDFQGLAGSLPFPGNINSVISNPTSLFPTINDFDINALCANTQSGTLIDDMCAKARSFASPLDPITNILTGVDMKVDNFISGLNGVTSNVTSLINDVGVLNVGFNSLTGDVASLQSGVTGVCNGINSRLSTIRNGTVSFPARNFTLDLGFVGTFSIPVDIPLNAQPFSGLSGIGCPAF